MQDVLSSETASRKLSVYSKFGSLFNKSFMNRKETISEPEDAVKKKFNEIQQFEGEKLNQDSDQQGQ